MLNSINQDRIIVGLVLENKKDEVLLTKNKIERIDREVYDVPTIEIEKIDEKEIINLVNKKYNLKLKNISGYINEQNILDENCNKQLKINLSANIDNDKKINKENMIWKKVKDILNEEKYTEPLKDIMCIYEYNSKFKENNV